MTRENTELYFAAWEALRPSMQSLLSQCSDRIIEALGEGVVQALAQVQSGDEEFKLSQDWKIYGDDESVVGCDIKLADALVHGEGEPGFAVSLEIQGYGGLYIGAITPKNYTPEMFTLDHDDLGARLRDIEAALPEVVDTIVNHLNKHKDTSAQRPTPC